MTTPGDIALAVAAGADFVLAHRLG